MGFNSGFKGLILLLLVVVVVVVVVVVAVGGQIFRTRPDRPWDPLSLLYNGYRVFPGGKAAGTWR